MKKIIPMLAAVTLIGLVGCNQQHAGMDNATMTRKMDSAYAAQRQSVVDDVTNMCSTSMESNVQMKVDSILAARGAK